MKQRTDSEVRLSAVLFTFQPAAHSQLKRAVSINSIDDVLAWLAGTDNVKEPIIGQLQRIFCAQLLKLFGLVCAR